MIFLIIQKNRNKSEINQIPKYIIILLVLPVTLSCFLFYSIKSKINLALEDDIDYNSLLTVTEINNEYSYQKTLAVTEKNKPILIYFNQKNDLHIGDKLALHDKAKSISAEDIGYQQKLLEGIGHIYYANTSNITVIQTNKQTGFIYKAGQSIKRNLSETLAPECSAVIQAMLTGDKSGIYPLLYKNFRLSGTLHLLACSGMNIALISFLPLVICRLLKTPKWVTYLLIHTVLIPYILICGMQTSIIRAYLMFTLFSFFSLAGYRYDSLNILTLAALILLIFNPASLLSMGFQLTFAATAGILLTTEKYYKILRISSKRMKTIIASSMSAQLFTLPVIFINIHEINLNGLFTNILAIPLASIMTIYGTVYTFLTYIIPIKLLAFTSAGLNILTETFLQILAIGAKQPFMLNNIMLNWKILLIITLMTAMPLVIYKFFSSTKAYTSLITVIILLFSGGAVLAKNYRNQTENIEGCVITDNLNQISIRGNLSNCNETRKIIQFLKKDHHSQTTIELVKINNQSINNCILLLNNAPVDTLILPSTAITEKRFNNLTEVIMSNNVILKIKSAD